MCVACDGDILEQDFSPGHDPIEDVVGPSSYSRCVLLDMERTTYIDSSGIGWMLICHKHFIETGGRLISTRSRPGSSGSSRSSTCRLS